MRDYSKTGMTPEEINGESPLWCFLWLVTIGVVAGLASLGFCSGLLISAFVITFCLDWLLFHFGFWASMGSGVLSAVLFPVGLWLFGKMKPDN